MSMGLGKRLLLSRRDLDLTQEELAERAGISRSYIANVERGRVTNVGVETLTALAGALGVSPAYLMGITDDPLAGVADGEVSTVNESPIDDKLRALFDLVDQMDDVQRQLMIEIARAVASNSSNGNFGQ